LSPLTRTQLLRGAAGVLFVPTLGRKLDLFHDLAEATVTATPDVRHFVSRPDLTPPVLTVDQGRGIAAPGLVFLAPSSGPGSHGPMVVDRHGELVWFRPVPKGTAPTDFKVQRLHGKPVLTWWQGKIVKGLGDGHWVVADTSYRELFRVHAARHLPGDLHDFQISPEGTAIVASSELVRWPHGRVVGGVVQELALPSGRLIREWRSLQHVPVEETEVRGKPGPQFDYFHLNSVDIDSDGDLLIGGRNVWAAYKVDRRTGRVRWRLGGKRSDFKLGPGVRFYWQHDVRHHGGNRISIFDNGAAPPKEPRSRVLMLKLDVRRRRATLEHAFVHRPQTVLSHYMGNGQLLSDGHTFVGWGGSPYVTEFAADGSIVFDAHLPRGGQSYRAFRFAWTGRPAVPPDLVVSSGALYASWNGATGVASWRVYEDGRATTTAPRTGFETVLRPVTSAKKVAVAALDANGHELGRSVSVAL
jgi:arylsulfotransferase ASST